MDIITIISIVVGFLLISLISLFNNLVRLKNRVQEAWADIDVQLKRRYNLIPNLIETVRGYADHEKKVFKDVTEARTQALNAEKEGNPDKIQEAENMLEGTLKSLFAVSENYPDLKADANFLELQRELSDTENKIQAARRFYNTMVKDFNTKMEMFPWNLMIKVFNFEKREYFELEEVEERAVPKVDL
ncbi:MAG: LemA family protein [Candidatus Paceibacterota bacterium]